MDDDEEDIVFDQASLLGRRVEKKEKEPPPGQKYTRCFVTFSLCAAFFGLGLCIAIPGATLLDLSQQTHTNTEEISRIFTGRSVGYLVGSIVAGFLFDVMNQHCLLSFGLLSTAIGTAVAPWCTNLSVLTSILAVQGVAMGFLDTGGNVLCLSTWGKDSAPYMQTLHFAFGLGAFVAPLVATPFIAMETNVTVYEQYGNESQWVEITTPADGLQVHHRIIRDVPDHVIDIHNQARRQADKPENTIDSNLLNLNINATTPSLVPEKPKKPKVVDAAHLSSDSKVAGGQNLKKLKPEKPPDTPPPEPDQIPPSTTISVNGTESNVTVSGSTTTTTTPTTTTKTTTTTTTTRPTTTTTTTPTTTTTTPTTTFTTTVKHKKPECSFDTYDGKNDYTFDCNGTYGGNNTKSVKNTFGYISDKVSQAVGSVRKAFKQLTKVQFAYFAIAGFVLLTSFFFFIACCQGKCTLRAVTIGNNQPDFRMRESKGFRIQILILMFVFYFLYVGAEVTFGGLISTFAVKYLNWDKVKATFLTSVYWGSFAFGRGIAIPISRCLSPVIMLIVDLIMTTGSVLGLIMTVDSSEPMVWFCTATLGLGMASIFPTGYNWAEKYMQVTEKASAILVVGSALGEMVFPVTTGYLFQFKGPMWMLYLQMGTSILSIFIYIIMQNLASNMGERYERLRQLNLSLMNDEEEGDEIEMDDVPLMASSSSANGSPGTHAHARRLHKKKVTFKLDSEDDFVPYNGHATQNGIGKSLLRHSTNQIKPD